MGWRADLDTAAWRMRYEVILRNMGTDRILRIIGAYVTKSYMPYLFSTANWPPPHFRAGRRLMDTGQLLKGFVYQIKGPTCEIYNKEKYARIQDQGGEVTPKTGRYLNIPLADRLSVSQRRNFPKGKSAIEAMFAGSKGMVHEPPTYKSPTITRGPNKGKKRTPVNWEGPGIYWKGKRIVIWAKKVKIPGMHFMKWTPDLLARVGKAIGSLVKAQA